MALPAVSDTTLPAHLQGNSELHQAIDLTWPLNGAAAGPESVVKNLTARYLLTQPNHTPHASSPQATPRKRWAEEAWLPWA